MHREPSSDRADVRGGVLAECVQSLRDSLNLHTIVTAFESFIFWLKSR